MIYDYYADLAEISACPAKTNQENVGPGFSDGCLVWSCRRKEGKVDPKSEARTCYINRVKDTAFGLPNDLKLDTDLSSLPDPSWLGIAITFTLKTPWFAKDDRPFHVLDNPVRKDRVFGVPYLSASSWKGLLRWTYGMETRLIGSDPENDSEKLNQAKRQIVHLFGNERDEKERFQSGALAFYPTWFDKVGFEVINPHSRKTRAGRQPICYEVVPAETEGHLRLLYAPLPGQAERDKVEPLDALLKLVECTEDLLTKHGISAKRTAGWGAAEIKERGWRLYGARESATEETPRPAEPTRKFKSLQDLGVLSAELESNSGKTKKELIEMLEKHFSDHGAKR